MKEEVAVHKEQVKNSLEHNVTSALIPSVNWLTFIGTIFGYLTEADVANQKSTPIKDPREHVRVLKEALGENYLQKHWRWKKIAVIGSAILGSLIVTALFILLKTVWVRVLLIGYILPFIIPTLYTLLMLLFVAMGFIEAFAFTIESKQLSEIQSNTSF
jgi:hypothetical protein